MRRWSRLASASRRSPSRLIRARRRVVWPSISPANGVGGVGGPAVRFRLRTHWLEPGVLPRRGLEPTGSLSLPRAAGPRKAHPAAKPRGGDRRSEKAKEEQNQRGSTSPLNGNGVGGVGGPAVRFRLRTHWLEPGVLPRRGLEPTGSLSLPRAAGPRRAHPQTE